MTDQANTRPQELVDRLDGLMDGDATPPEPAGRGGVSTNPNESAAEHEPMAIADSDHTQEPSEQAGGS